MKNFNDEVSHFLDKLDHPLRLEINLLRQVILSSNPGLEENIKWNGPNYYIQGQDKITMKIQPPKQIQLIFHRGAKKLSQPKDKLIEDNSKLLVWKENDRAVATFKKASDINKNKAALELIITSWINATKF